MLLRSNTFTALVLMFCSAHIVDLGDGDHALIAPQPAILFLPAAVLLPNGISAEHRRLRQAQVCWEISLAPRHF